MAWCVSSVLHCWCRHGFKFSIIIRANIYNGEKYVVVQPKVRLCGGITLPGVKISLENVFGLAHLITFRPSRSVFMYICGQFWFYTESFQREVPSQLMPPEPKDTQKVTGKCFKQLTFLYLPTFSWGCCAFCVPVPPPSHSKLLQTVFQPT